MQGMKPKPTELVFILNKSGFINGMESDITVSYNGILNKAEEEALITRL